MGHAIQIIETVARFRGISVTKLRGPSLARRYAWPRQEASFVLRHRTNLSLPQIGRFLGYCDHTSVMHGIRAVEGGSDGDPAYSQQIENLLREIDNLADFNEAHARETVQERARRVLHSAENSSATDAVLLATALLTTLSVLKSVHLSDREARVAAKQAIAGSGELHHA